MSHVLVTGGRYVGLEKEKPGMHVFVATRINQSVPFDGAEGELVRPSVGSVGNLAEPGGSFTGLASGRRVMHARVADLDYLGATPFRSLFYDSLVRDHGLSLGIESHRWAMKRAEMVMSAAQALDVDTVVTFDGSEIRSVFVM